MLATSALLERALRGPLRGGHCETGTRAFCWFESCPQRRRASPPTRNDAHAGAGTGRAPSRMTRTNNEPEPTHESGAMLASLKAQEPARQDAAVGLSAARGDS